MNLIKTKIDASQLQNWTVGKKVKPLRAKPMASLMNDQSVTSKFLISTLEGIQNIKPDSMVCIGADNDAWQQERAKLLKTYSVTEITADGWMICTPKPEAARHVVEVTDQIVMGEFLLTNTQWGEKQEDGSFAQTGHRGDFIVRSIEDPKDFWIVKRSVFLSTYEISEQKPETDRLLGAPRYPAVEGS